MTEDSFDLEDDDFEDHLPEMVPISLQEIIDAFLALYILREVSDAHAAGNLTPEGSKAFDTVLTSFGEYITRALVSGWLSQTMRKNIDAVAFS